MPKTINAVGLGAFPSSSLTVPVGTDSRSNAAEAVESIAQEVVNRLEYLRVRAVMSDAGGVIDDGQQLQCTVGALDQANNIAPIEFLPSVFVEAFYPLITAQMGASEVRMYAAPSPNSATEQFAITVNAKWNAAANKWTQITASKESFALLFRTEESPGPVNSRLIVAKKAAGDPDWTTWTRAAIEAGTVIGEEWLYPTPLSTITLMGCGTARAGGHDGGNGAMLTDGSLAHGFVDIRFPPNWDTSTASIEVVHYQATAAPASIALVERSVNFTTPAAATQNVLVTASGPGSSGYKKTSVSLTGVVFDPTAKEYRLRWIPGDAGDKFEGWRITGWKDLGPRNSLS